MTSIQLQDQLVAEIDRLAEAMGRPREWVVEQAVARFLEDDAWQVAAIQAELDAYRADPSDTLPHEQVMAELSAMFLADVHADPLAPSSQS